MIGPRHRLCGDRCSQCGALRTWPLIKDECPAAFLRVRPQRTGAGRTQEQREKQRAWRVANKERRTEYSRQWRAENVDKAREACRESCRRLRERRAS